MKRVTIIGAGPSGLMAAIMIKSLAKEKNEKTTSKKIFFLFF